MSFLSRTLERSVRKPTINLMEQYLLKIGISPSRALFLDKPLPENKIAHYDMQCPICKAHFSSKLLRCPKCDTAVFRKKPTGTRMEQGQFLDEYVTEYARVMTDKKKALKQKIEEQEDRRK